MNANDSLERGIADVYEREAPQRAPDWVLASVLDTVDKTPQRRVLIPAPWRIHPMNSFAKLAIAAVVVIAIGALGLSVLGPRSPSGVGGQPSASASLRPSPSVSPDPSAPPALSSTFTSTRPAYAISYPTGWKFLPASQPWKSELYFQSPEGDSIYDGQLLDHLFLGIASQPLGGIAGDAWVTGILGGPEGCGEGGSQPITIDGASGRICGGLAALSAADRGYTVRLYTSGDEPWLERYYDSAWFQQVLETMQLRPEDAIDTPASPSASPSS
ncbi:MAG TPA: hypothetical protein VK867_08740 [Candidatus Limnocylindrales bacterium]|nr:hypothetical protein [Candidatus Limnocylindrales bacterium]